MITDSFDIASAICFAIVVVGLCWLAAREIPAMWQGRRNRRLDRSQGFAVIHPNDKSEYLN